MARNYKPEGSPWYNGSVDADATAETLRSESFDLVVIGGGIIGTGVAWIAARAGLRVALCERDDLAAWTSSASSKLIHGGLRYLRMGDVKLVREAHTERRALARVVAPHLVRPLRFVMPLRADGPYGPVLIGAGMVAYGALSGFRDGPTLVVAPPRAHALAPALRTDGLRAGGVYHDHQTDDARLVVAVARAAAACGATIATRCEVVSLDVRDGRTSHVEVRSAAGEEITIRTRAVVNATGPWVDSLRRLEDARAGTSSLLSKGAHLVLETDERWPSAVTVPLDRVRVSFALPYNGMLVLGTTDEPYEGDPAGVLPNAADQERILAEAGSALRADVVDPARVRFRFAGLRALPLDNGDTASTRRESVLSRGPGGMLSVAGGKYTTFRRIALDVVRALAPELGLHALDEHAAPLADAADPDTMAALLCTRPYALDPELARHLARLYGAAAPAVASLALEDASLLEPLHSASPDIGAQVVWARHAEWATEVDDVVRRRTSLVFRGHDDADVRARVATLLERPMPPAARAAA
ncbi:MAG: glycerol-3-phosphate dehydrogenase [Gaiellales bacterium]|nr:glycerol-3-phosphate dehydrogenase [Gaiellales bacterium]